jgi:hypothetical protein
VNQEASRIELGRAGYSYRNYRGITVSSCSDIVANELVYWLAWSLDRTGKQIHTSARFCHEGSDCTENVNVPTANLIEVNGTWSGHCPEVTGGQPSAYPHKVEWMDKTLGMPCVGRQED